MKAKDKAFQDLIKLSAHLIGAEEAKKLAAEAYNEQAFLRAVLTAASSKVHLPIGLPVGRLELIIEEIPFAIFVIAPGNRITMLNRAAEIVSGRARGELVGKTIREAFAGSALAESLTAVVERSRSGRPPLEYRISYELPAGGHLELGLTAALAARAPLGREECDVVVVGRDLHAPSEDLRLRARSKLPAELESDLRARLRQVERQMMRSEKLVAIGQMAAGFIHEINNPLGVLSGLVQMMQMDTPNDDSRAGLLSQMAEELERIHKIASNLLELARTPMGTGAEAFRPVEMVELIKGLFDLMSPQFKAARVVGQLEAHTQTAYVLGDPERLRQVFLNLLLNAVQAMSPPEEIPPRGGRLTVRVSNDRVTENDLPPRPSRVQDLAGRGEEVLVEEAAKRAYGDEAPPWKEGLALVRLEVEDTGPGIPQDVLPRLFEPFFTTKPPGHGTGLGLSIAHAIVLSHGGTISASNAPSGGALFVVRLPMYTGDDASVPPKTMQGAK